MDHLAFYNAGCDASTGGSRLKLKVRKLARKILLPPSIRLVEILASLVRRLDTAEAEIHKLQVLVDDLRRRQEDQAGRVPATLAFGWDYVAMVRRLAVLEEHVDTLLAAREDAGDLPALADSSSRFVEADAKSRPLAG